MFIVIEGIDGAGKTTLSRQLAALVPGQTTWTCEPTRGRWGRRARQLGAAGNHRGALSAFLRDRVEHLRRVVRPALEAGRVVICDRYTLSTAVYQGRDAQHVHELVRWQHAQPWLLTPDLCLVLDLPPEAAWRRLARRGSPEGDFERRDKLDARRARYRRLANHLPWCRLVDARCEDVVDQAARMIEVMR